MKKNLLMLCLLACAIVGRAVKADPTPVVVVQPDGTQLTVFQHGDEHFSWQTTIDGVLLTQVGRAFYVARVEKNGELKASAMLAHETNARSMAERRLIRAQRPERFYAVAEKQEHRKIGIGSPWVAYFPHTGTPKVLTILVQFSDTTFSSPNPQRSFNDFFNATGVMPNYTLNEQRNHGSVGRYFHEMSGGKFKPQFDVVGPVTLNKPSAYYGHDEGSFKDSRIDELIRDASSAVTSQVNFGDYDSNNDGYVDLVMIVYAGYSQGSSGNRDDIWPKAGMGSSFQIGGKTINRYCVTSELNYSPTRKFQSPPNKRISGIGLACHEFSHTMGLPDFYPYNAGAQINNQAMEYWDLMDNGEYTDNGYTPTPYTPWEKEVMGWQQIQTLSDTPAAVTLQSGEARKVNSANEGEYLILHNIQNTGWASKMRGHGLLVYRVDYGLTEVNMNDHVNDFPGRPGMTIVPADGLLITAYDVKTSGNPNGHYTSNEFLDSHAGDPFPGTSGVTSLTNVTLNKSTLQKPILNINEDVSTGVITFNFLNNTPSGIDNTTIEKFDNNRFYTLDGRFVGFDSSVLPKGIYIRGNKKFVKK